MKAIGYIRVSTVDQADSGLSLEAQQTKIRTWSDANGYELTEIFTDAGISGKRADNRPGLQDALNVACKVRSSGTAMVVYSLSRLARSTKDAIAIAERLDKAGADLVSLSEKIDTTSAAGKMVFRMLAVLAEFERDLVSERTTAALAVKRRNGQRISGRIPYGYDLADDGVMLMPNEVEQAVIRDMGAMRSGGMSLEKIAAELTDRNVATKTGRSKRWGHRSVASILHRASPRLEGN